MSLVVPVHRYLVSLLQPKTRQNGMMWQSKMEERCSPHGIYKAVKNQQEGHL